MQANFAPMAAALHGREEYARAAKNFAPARRFRAPRAPLRLARHVRLGSAMLQIAQVLCPVDFSDFSRRSLDHASALARWYGARLTLLHVFVNRPAVDLPPTPMTDGERQRLTSDLRRLAAHVPFEVPLDLRVTEAGDIHREILIQAEMVSADLIVLGTHGRSGFERLVLGSVAERVVRKAPCPTMVVPRQALDTAPDEPVRFRRVVCPVDFSDASVRAVQYARSLAEEARAQLILLHVLDVPPEILAHPMSAGFDVDRIRADAVAEAERHLQALVPEPRPHCVVKPVVREGAVYREILVVAAERAADLIVMGVQGRGAVDLMVFGSNTARVMRAAACPVLVLPPA
ncbi:MAG: universal stress protein [Acidobacteria bacterium]|nr:universal stress protein [Acidobacteriota bacterium]